LLTFSAFTIFRGSGFCIHCPLSFIQAFPDFSGLHIHCVLWIYVCCGGILYHQWFMQSLHYLVQEITACNLLCIHYLLWFMHSLPHWFKNHCLPFMHSLSSWNNAFIAYCLECLDILCLTLYIGHMYIPQFRSSQGHAYIQILSLVNWYFQSLLRFTALGFLYTYWLPASLNLWFTYCTALIYLICNTVFALGSLINRVLFDTKYIWYSPLSTFNHLLQAERGYYVGSNASGVLCNY